MTASKIDGFFLPLQATYHQAPFERAGNHRGQVPGFNIAPDLASSLALFYNGLETIKPRTQACRALARSRGLPSSESMAVFSSGQPPAPVRRAGPES